MDSNEFREWLGSELATQQLAQALAESQCQGCDLPLSDDVETGDSDYVGGATLCKECWLEWTGVEK